MHRGYPASGEPTGQRAITPVHERLCSSADLAAHLAPLGFVDHGAVFDHLRPIGLGHLAPSAQLGAAISIFQDAQMAVEKMVRDLLLAGCELA